MATQLIAQRIDDLILEDGYTSYDKLPDDLIYELTALSIEEAKFPHEVLIECNDVDGCLRDLICYLIKGTPEAAEKLAETMRDNSRLYFKNHLTDLFNERYRELECEKKREAGLIPITDRINGETRWIR